ncbi:MAG: Uma2 family endonuclease [Blastocatellia bacterium]|nr:Uma2 family endonuclease [Blastocatellia bacterium]
MSALPKRKYTIEEYIELLKTSEERFEYFDGELFSMAGGKFAHGVISANVLIKVGQQLANSTCRAFGPDVGLKVPAAPPFRFPDASVVCGQPVIQDFHGIDLLVNPVLIVEVLSDSTADYDLGKKFLAYQSIESFREYLAVAQKHSHVMQYTKEQNGLWVRRDFIGMDSEIQLASLNIPLTLKEIYENVQFPASEEQ